MDYRVLEKLVFHGACLHLLTSQVSKQKTKAMILMWTLYLKMAQDGHQNKSSMKKKSKSTSSKEWNQPPFLVGNLRLSSFYELGVVLDVLHISCPLKSIESNFWFIFPVSGFSGNNSLCQGRTVTVANNNFSCNPLSGSLLSQSYQIRLSLSSMIGSGLYWIIPWHKEFLSA